MAKNSKFLTSFSNVAQILDISNLKSANPDLKFILRSYFESGNQFFN